MQITRRSIFATIAVCVVAVVVSGVWISRNLFPPHFSVTEKEDGIALHALTLGEYATPVRELTIMDDSHSVVTRFVAKSEQSMMHTVTVTVGRNDYKDLFLDGYSIEGANYEFGSGVVYSAHVRWASRDEELQFRLKEKTPNQALQTTPVTRSEI